MIQPTGGADKALGVNLSKIYKTLAVDEVDKTTKKDIASISELSALVKHGQACAMSQPDIRADKVERARQLLQDGKLPDSADMAAKLINRAVEGQV